MNGRTCSVRICMVLLIMVCFMVLATSAELVSATEVYKQEDYSVPAYEVRYFSVYLAEGAGMAGWLRINNGDGIHFFIVDEFGHNEIQSTGTATTAYKVRDYPRAEGNWYYWNFIAPDADTWYVYFSNAVGTAYAGVGDELDIIIRTDTEAPSIQMSTVLNSVHGTVVIGFTATDDCFPVEKVELYVDGVLIDTKINPDTVTGYVFSGTFEWRSYEWDNGNYTVFLRAYDALGKVGDYHFPGQVEVVNGFFDLLNNIVILILLYSLVIFTLLMWKLTVKPTDEKEKWLHSSILFGVLGFMFVLTGSMMIPGLDSELTRGLLFLIGLSLLNLTGVCSTYYLSARYNMHADTKNQEDAGENTEERQTASLNIDQLLGRSDILDKTRGNIRTGASVVLGVGSGISWWIVNQNRSESIIELMFLIAGAGLACFSIASLLISLSYIAGEAEGIFLGEDLIPEDLSPDQYVEQLKRIIRLKARTLSYVRQAIGIGMLWFILLSLVGASLPIYFATTILSSYPLIAISTIIPITIMIVAIVRFSRIVLGSRGLRLMEN